MERGKRVGGEGGWRCWVERGGGVGCEGEWGMGGEGMSREGKAVWSSVGLNLTHLELGEWERKGRLGQPCVTLLAQLTDADLKGLLASRELRLCDQSLGPGGGGAAALLVRASTSLYVCDLSRNGIGDAGAPGAHSCSSSVLLLTAISPLALPPHSHSLRTPFPS